MAVADFEAQHIITNTLNMNCTPKRSPFIQLYTLHPHPFADLFTARTSLPARATNVAPPAGLFCIERDCGLMGSRLSSTTVRRPAPLPPLPLSRTFVEYVRPVTNPLTPETPTCFAG